jgi:hypothetical protein
VWAACWPGAFATIMECWESEAVRLFLALGLVIAATVSAAAQQQPCNNPRTSLFGISERANLAIAAQRDFENAVCEYRNCLAANQDNANACEGLRRIMDATAQAAGQNKGSR